MVKAIVGANWGDEGKGKITDMFAEQADVVIRFQGGANAGHTIINDYGRFALHTLPSGVFYPNITNIIGNGIATIVVGKWCGELDDAKLKSLLGKSTSALPEQMPDLPAPKVFRDTQNLQYIPIDDYENR